MISGHHQQCEKNQLSSPLEVNKRRTQPIIPAGEIVVVTTGAHEDYVIYGLFRTKTEINVDELITQWCHNNYNSQQTYIKEFDEDKFINSISPELLEPISLY